MKLDWNIGLKISQYFQIFARNYLATHLPSYQVKFTQVTFKRTLKFGAVLKKPWEKILDNTTKKKEKEKRFRVRVDRKDYYLKINF